MRESSSLLTGPFVRLLLANFCFFLTFASFFLLPLHVRALGGDERVIGLVMGTAGVAGLVSLFVAGPLLDRFGRRPFLLGGLATMAVATAGFLIVDRIGPALFGLRALQGLAFAAGFNAASTLAVELAPAARRAAALGIFGVSTLATHALAPALGEVLVRHRGFPALFEVAAACSVVAVVLAWSLDVPPPLHAARAVRLRPSRTLASASVTVGFCGVAFGAVLTYVPTFVEDAHLGRVGTFFLCYTGAAVLTRVTAGGLGDLFDRRSVILPSLGLLAASIVCLAAVRSAGGLAGAGLAFGLAQGISYPTLNAYAVDHVAPETLGRAQTLYNGAFNVGVTSGSIALGTVVHAAGHRAMFLCAAGVAAVAFAVFLLGTRPSLDRAASPVG
jgi:MFS family permease